MRLFLFTLLILLSNAGCQTGEVKSFTDASPAASEQWYHKGFKKNLALENDAQFGFHKVDTNCDEKAALSANCFNVYSVKLKLACKVEEPGIINVPVPMRFKNIDVRVRVFYHDGTMSTVYRTGPTDHQGVWFTSFENPEDIQSSKVLITYAKKEYLLKSSDGGLLVEDPLCNEKPPAISYESPPPQ